MTTAPILTPAQTAQLAKQIATERGPVVSCWACGHPRDNGGHLNPAHSDAHLRLMAKTALTRSPFGV